MRPSTSRSTTSGPSANRGPPRCSSRWPTQWQKGGYDVRWLFRTILNTDAYQRRVRSTANAAGKTPFASSCPSRLRADQVFDALGPGPGVTPGCQRQSAAARRQRRRAGGAGPRPRADRQASLKGGGIPAGSIQADSVAAEVTKGHAKKAAEAAGSGLPGRQEAGAAMRAGGPRLLFDRLFGVDPSVRQ